MDRRVNECERTFDPTPHRGLAMAQRRDARSRARGELRDKTGPGFPRRCEGESLISQSFDDSRRVSVCARARLLRPEGRGLIRRTQNFNVNSARNACVRALSSRSWPEPAVKEN